MAAIIHGHWRTLSMAVVGTAATVALVASQFVLASAVLPNPKTC